MVVRHQAIACCVLAFGLIGGSALSAARSQAAAPPASPATSAGPEASVPSLPTPEPSASGAPALRPLDVTVVELPDGRNAFAVADGGAAGLVVVGDLEQQGRRGEVAIIPRAWYSPDGLEWTGVDLRAPKGGSGQAFGVVRWGAEWLATGDAGHCPGPAGSWVWHSSDGLHWEKPQALDALTIRGPAIVGDRLMGFGAAGDPCRASGGGNRIVLQSSDGRDWIPTPVDYPGYGAYRWAFSPDGPILLAGGELRPDGGGMEWRLWLARDGRTFEPIEWPDGPEQAGEMRSVSGMLWMESGILLTANRRDADGVTTGTIWASPDAMTWEPVHVGEQLGPLGTGGSSFYATSGASIMESRDGRVWEALTGPVVDGIPHAIAARDDGTVVVAGRRGQGSASDPAVVWTGIPKP